jgi:M6 family metalloprotease-like protein
MVFFNYFLNILQRSLAQCGLSQITPMKNTTIILFGILLFVCQQTIAQRSNCAAYPDLIEVTQPDGSKTSLYIKGNEVFHYYETTDGYTVLQNTANLGRYEYAQQAANGFIVPSGVVVGQSFNKTAPAKGLKPNKQQIKAAYTQFMGNTPASAFNKTNGSSIFPSLGKRKLLVVLMQFPDDPTIFSTESFERMLSEEGYHDNACEGSFRDYYLANSNGALDLDITVMGWYTASRPRIEYGQKDAQGNSNPDYNSNVQELVAQTIDSAEAAGVNFADYDNDGDGDMDGLVIFHAGFGAEQAKNGYIWSHRWTLWSNNDRFYDGVSIKNYCINPSKRDFNDGNGTTQVRIGVVSHEFGHVLGLPDLYDTDNASEGAGNWCIMSGGGWLNKESNPSRQNAWCKTELGWMTSTVLSANGKYTLYNTTDSNMAFRVNTPVPNEYFLLENRQRKAWDKYLPGKGMVVWHINTNKADDYSLFGANDVNTDTAMYGVGVVQADGLRELERNINRGTAGDPYPGSTNNTTFTAASIPGSGLHERDINGNPMNSNITIVNITQMPDSTVTFDFGGIASSSFKASAVTGCSPLAVSFTNQSVFSAGYKWNLGNGNSSTEINPKAVYDSAGTYVVSLIVYNNANEPIDTFSSSIVVFKGPKADAIITRTDSSVSFSNKSKDAAFFSWRFGNMSSQAVNPTFTFTGPVIFTLIAYSNNGCTDTLRGNLWYNGLGDLEPDFTALQLFPNPVKDLATLSFKLKNASDMTLSIVNVLGQEVYTENTKQVSAGIYSFELNTKTLTEPGIYFLKVKTDNQESVLRLLKE